MDYHLLTIEELQPLGNAWSVRPRVSLRRFVARGPKLMMPMPGEEVELRLPDGRVTTATIASFGVDVWTDGEGNMYTDSNPAAPMLTLTITGSEEVGAAPAGTEVWLTNARSAPATDAGQ